MREGNYDLQVNFGICQCVQCVLRKILIRHHVIQCLASYLINWSILHNMRKLYFRLAIFTLIYYAFPRRSPLRNAVIGYDDSEVSCRVTWNGCCISCSKIPRATLVFWSSLGHRCDRLWYRTLLLGKKYKKTKRFCQLPSRHKIALGCIKLTTVKVFIGHIIGLYSTESENLPLLTKKSS